MDPILSQFYNETTFRWSYRQPPNLGHLLCPSGSITHKSMCIASKCKFPTCQICFLLIHDNTIKMENGVCHNVNKPMNCNSLYLIYMILCLKCGSTYIGETENFRARVNLHKSQTRNADLRKLRVNKHMFECSQEKFKVSPIFKCKNDNLLYRKQMEKNL